MENAKRKIKLDARMSLLLNILYKGNRLCICNIVYNYMILKIEWSHRNTYDDTVMFSDVKQKWEWYAFSFKHIDFCFTSWNRIEFAMPSM